MRKTTQLTLTLVPRPGVLAKLARTLADAGVNIMAISARDTAGRTKIRLLVNKPARAKRALRKAKYHATEEPAFVMRLPNKPGALARVAGRLAQARITIKSAYATTAGRAATVVFTVGNTAKARKVLRDGGGSQDWP